MVRARSIVTSFFGAALLAGGLSSVTSVPVVAAPRAAAGSTCSVLDDPVYQRVKPSNGASLLTPWTREAQSAGTYGFTQDDGALFSASLSASSGLVEVHRLYRGRNLDFSAAWDPDEIAKAVEEGYTDQGKTFFASSEPAPCLVPIYRYSHGSKHRFAVSAADRGSLEEAGWDSEGITFYAAPAGDAVEGSPGTAPVPTTPPTPVEPPLNDADTHFGFAVYPDTQQEVGTDRRFVDRANWLVAHRSELDLRFVTHTGDVVNWDTDDHSQYEVASKAMEPLEAAKIPYSLAIGNHDTQATGPGGAARNPKRTRQLQRDTGTFNNYFNAERFGGVSGRFEKDKVDNIYSLYEAGGVKWMVLVLEMWPRASAVAWAKEVVAEHPDHNVIVVTHDYLDPSGQIEQSAGYGDTSPQQLYDALVSQYANVRLVLSGHVGVTSHRIDTGKNGNKVYSFMTTIHAGKTNPIRLFDVDTSTGTLKTRVYAPWTDQTWDEATESLTAIDWVR